MLNLHHFSHRTGNAKWEGETARPGAGAMAELGIATE
jgi:hypothetical protein